MKILILQFLLLFFSFIYVDLIFADKSQGQLKGNSRHEKDLNIKDAKPSQKKTSGTDSNLIKLEKKDFQKSLKILEKETIDSQEYIKAVKFLELSLYNKTQYDSLSLLAGIYEEKKDFQNQLKVLNILVSNYPDKMEVFFLIGKAYKNLYLNVKEDQESNKNLSIESFDKVLKLNPKYDMAFRELLPLLQETNLETDELIHTKESLYLVMDILKQTRKPEYYIELCKAYYENSFLKQSYRACKRSIKKNPKDPMSYFFFALSFDQEKDIDKNLLKVAIKFDKSFYVQYHTALYFLEKNPSVSIKHFHQAYALQPKHIKSNQFLAETLFRNKQEEASYKYFLDTCLMTDGHFLATFRKSKNELRAKKNKKLFAKFEDGINTCFLVAKKKKKRNQK